MRSRRRAPAWLASLLVAVVLGGSGRLGAQSVTLALSALAGDSTSPAPEMTVTGVPGRPEFGPYTVSLEMSLEPQFRTPFYVRDSDQSSATFRVDSLLPERAMVFFRARLTDGFRNVVAEVTDHHPVRSWLRLEQPAEGNPANLSTRNPKFVWSSPAITVPPGLWVYNLTVINKLSTQPELSTGDITDTSFTFSQPLESNTAYRWQVRARAQSGAASDQVTVVREGSFVISSLTQPTFTLLYQGFPNPFGRGERSDSTCFWIDLAHDATIKLTIYNIQLREVRNVIPSAKMSGVLPRRSVRPPERRDRRLQPEFHLGRARRPRTHGSHGRVHRRVGRRWPSPIQEDRLQSAVACASRRSEPEPSRCRHSEAAPATSSKYRTFDS